jgi:hypothetical protein
MNTLFATIVAKVRDEARNIKGSNDRGPYSFYVVEILDQDDNKHEVTLPRDSNGADLIPGEMYVFDLKVSAKGGFLQLSAQSVTLHSDYANA